MIPWDTDYSIQTLADIVQDLEELTAETGEALRSASSLKEQLLSSGYWERVDVDFQIFVSKASIFLETVEQELSEVHHEVARGVRSNHPVRLRALGVTSSKLNRDCGRIWHEDSRWKEYGVAEFKVVEQVYETVGNQLVALGVLVPMSERLKDFVQEGDAGVAAGGSDEVVNLRPNLGGLGVDLRALWRRVHRNRRA